MNEIILDTIKKTVEEVGPELDALSKALYEKPELAYEEVLACKLHSKLLEKYGFSITRNFCDIETGFKAEYDSGKPGRTVGIMAEYDALPEIGHGCGHNILGATSTGAGIGLKSVIDEIGGKVIVYGTPAEENNGAKMYYAKKGGYDELDFAMMAHPNATYNKCAPMLALGPVMFEFHGQTSHASASPEEGRNALDALVLAITAINALRQQIKSTSRIHGYIMNGGEATNIIPDYASAQYVVRSVTKTYNEELRQRVRNCIRGAALQTGTEAVFTDPEVYLDNMLINTTMENLFCDKMEEIYGITVAEPLSQSGSNDAGLLSKLCPFIHPLFSISETGVGTAHTVEFAEATQTDFAKMQMRKTAVGLAMTAVEVMTDKTLYARMREEFERAER